MTNRYLPGDVVARRKGLVMHKGIALGDGRVLHNTPSRGEHTSTEHEFRVGRRLHVTRLSAAERRRALGSIDDGSARRYHVFTNNCEHTVNRHLTGRAESPQLRGWALGLGLAAAALILTRHPVAAAAGFAVGRRLGGRKPGH